MKFHIFFPKQVDSNGSIIASGQCRKNKLTMTRDVSFVTAVVSQQQNKRMNSSFTWQLQLSVYFYILMLGKALNIAIYVLPLSINYKLQNY